MKSVNFEFLRARRAVLAELAGFAERYAHEDPASSLIKQRSFVEHASRPSTRAIGCARRTPTT
jgi:type I restriction enzyme R subunit